jgi:C-terminal processing protease CtpA/Prc
MGFITNTDAVIIDLRNNGGGDPAMVQLILSYFMDEKPVHYNSIYDRPTDSTRHYYSLEKVKGKKMPGKDLYILTSRNTFSAAEEFAYNFKNLKKAILVGETTGGGAHPTNVYAVNDYMVVGIPVAKAINPYTKTNWEGTGVEPDVKVDASQALVQAQKLAIEKAIAHTRDEAEKTQLQWTLTALNAQLSPVAITDKTKEQYVGTYSNRTISLEAGQLYYQREGRKKIRMIPLTEDLFGLEDLDYFRVQFVKDSKGHIEKLLGLYDSGEKDESPRTTKAF